ncbi:heterokaryon incompatibility protein-domain-containing protein [Diaporthe sp. PMI_573]|nr:heterokaryon incompatibility protein-domain-containing protein [Diaporthaceae sp. PMI_573]
MALTESARLFLIPTKARGDKEPASARLPWTLTSFTTNSEETFSKIKSWLDKCAETHVQCRVRRNEKDTTWHPTRLIEVLPVPQSGSRVEDLMCRIVELKSEPVPKDPDLRYITLSHRWPQNQEAFQRLTLDNLAQWKASLPVKTLQQTFRDSFLVAHKVGITYVWIDSLCIIQDGDEFEDWDIESPLMQKVYSNAEFNICASKNDQNGNHGGLFSLREPSNFQCLPHKLFDPDDHKFEDEDDYECNDSGHYLIAKRAPIAVWEEAMNASPLTSRGFIFQEQLLSRANLHFGNHEVFVECMGMRASESLGLDQDYEGPWRWWRSFFKEQLRISCCVEEKELVSSDESSDSDYVDDMFDKDVYKRWHELLSRSTKLHLTKSNDRLLALSGVAQHFKNSNDDLYIAGLWCSRLATELLWEVAEATPREN